MEEKIKEAAELLLNSRHSVGFTGAGISVESGIPPFRGKNGLWSKYDPIFLDLWYFENHPYESWVKIKEIFYDFFGKANPNKAHYVLAELESMGIIKSVITQNIDNLHQAAGSKNVIEFHGNSRTLFCNKCGKTYEFKREIIESLPPKCEECGGVLRPDFIFFSEPIRPETYEASLREAKSADVFLVIGTTGEIMPASQIPYTAKYNGAKIIEVNIEKSNYTDSITDIFLQGKATEIMEKLLNTIQSLI